MDIPNNKQLCKEDLRMVYGGVQAFGREAYLAGMGGVTLIEYAKDLIQTAASNVSSLGTNQIQIRKLVQRKLENLG